MYECIRWSYTFRLAYAVRCIYRHILIQWLAFHAIWWILDAQLLQMKNYRQRHRSSLRQLAAVLGLDTIVRFSADAKNFMRSIM